jgi:precorrin-6B C5,15-methyltransferase / cobalt-precorrin-6B C5,C15-methyltransferase
LAVSKVHIIGIGDDGLEGLTAAARQIVNQAELLLGARQSLAAAAPSKAEQVEIASDLDAVVRKLDAATGKRAVP